MIRPLLPTDEPEIARLIAKAFDAATMPIGPRWTSKQIAEECHTLGFVKEEAQRIEAFVLFRDLGDVWEISFLATDPERLRSGVMSEVMRRMIAERPTGRAIWLEVHEANLPARAFYERMGFIETGRRTKYYSDGGTAVLYNYG